MSFQEAVQSALIQNYANFRGRALRSEFWWFMLAFTIAGVVASAIDYSLLNDRTILETIVSIGAILPTLSVGARRLHDTDRTGWWQLLQVIPVIGIIVLIVWFVQVGTPGPNRFGPPLA